MLRIVILSCLLSCHSPPASATMGRQETSIACMPARVYGAIPDDGIDDRTALQQGLDACGGQALELEAGRYDIFTPPQPRSRDILVMATSETLEGIGLSTVLAFSGDSAGGEWHGIRPAPGFHIRRLALVTSLTRTVEQTHVVRGDGPLRGGEIDHVTCSHPAASGFKSGDCFNFSGYLASATSPDRVVWDVHIHHVDVLRSDRSGIAFHGGLRGTLMPDGHSTTRFDHVRCFGVTDQCMDGEGNTGGTDTVEIDHCLFGLWLGYESAAALQIQGSSGIHIHDNVSTAQSWDLLGCDACDVHDNVITLAVPSTSSVVSLQRAGSGTTFHDELYTRTAVAGPGYVLGIAQNLTVPDHVRVEDVHLVQGTGATALFASGIVGLSMRHLTASCDWSPAAGIAPETKMRMDAIAIAGAVGTRTTEIELSDSDVTGPYRSAIATGGGLGGAGTITISRTRATGMTNGIRCEGVAIGAGVTGPITYDGDSMPAPACSLVH
jgi:hypothetical protein